MSTDNPRILAVEHEESCPPALVGEWLAEAGCTLEVCRPYVGDALPDLTSYDGVLVLGGEMGANDDDTHAWLAPLKAGIRDAVAAGTPLFGICLGHQLVAAALPEGAVVLARTPGGEVQAARFAPRAWGIQAHPEAHSAIVRRWAETDREDEVGRGFDKRAVLAAIEESGPVLASYWKPMATRFAALVHEALR